MISFTVNGGLLALWRQRLEASSPCTQQCNQGRSCTCGRPVNTATALPSENWPARPADGCCAKG